MDICYKCGKPIATENCCYTHNGLCHLDCDEPPRHLNRPLHEILSHDSYMSITPTRPAWVDNPLFAQYINADGNMKILDVLADILHRITELEQGA